eukprot:TRINITY_DN2233_c0_g1_i1.p1 TRINITY_DN2233_c0_g1~~TRINITY_DN2233_c0_g1_i1.p1  ORF type:complete len:424 (+),score=127.91 TRINITY_DN2233_c0_g1_i1:56-1273(+)
MSQEHQEYIATKVNPILESLVTEVLLERPQNPVPFMVRWLAEHSKKGKDALHSLAVGEAERLRTEIRDLQEEIKTLSEKAAAAGGAMPAEEDKDSSLGGDSEEDDEDGDDPAPPPASYYKKGARGSVSAEAYGAFNQKKAFEPPVYPKSDEKAERIKHVMNKSFLFNTLDRQNFSVILQAFQEKTIAAGERIIQEGDDGDCMFLIESGAFDCKKIIGGEEKVVKKCGQGDVFGELALLYSQPRAASVEATEESLVWQLDRETFTHIVRDASSKRREVFMEFLHNVPLMKSLESYDLMQLADCLQPHPFQKGDRIISQGDVGDIFYIVEDGELQALKSVDGAAEQEVMTYKKGDYFGELALIKDAPRAASVIATTEGQLVSVDRKSFKNILGKLEGEMAEAALQYK